jgi:hypothetical protein
LIGVATSAWQVALLRAGAWTARGLRVPARNALLADVVPATAYGRACGFERAMDNLAAIGGPVFALGLSASAPRTMNGLRRTTWFGGRQDLHLRPPGPGRAAASAGIQPPRRER